MTKLEEVARAAFERQQQRNAGLVRPRHWDDVGALEKEHWLDVIRAALEALRIPSEGMVEYASTQFDWGPSGYYDAPQGTAYPDLVWNAMIDAALTEERAGE